MFGVLLVGLCGNNGSTLTASLLAHREGIEWKDSRGNRHTPDWLGSTIMRGSTSDPEGRTFHELYPFQDPLNMVIGGWDIQSINMSEAVRRAGVLNWQIEEKLRDTLEKITPMRGYYDPDYIAGNQRDRATHVMPEDASLVCVLSSLREDIRLFKKRHGRVIVLWTANTERMMEEDPEVHLGSWGCLFKAIIENRKHLVSPSMMYAIASILEGCPFLNGSPQNTLVPAIQDLARRERVYIGGSDFKTGQTRFKSMMADYLSCCGIRMGSVVSYNHLGNNDGKNLSEEKCFHSKEVTKRDVIKDIVEGNPALYDREPDHCIVIKYVPRVGDSKRAMDEYVCDIFMGGEQTFTIYNVCEDSLLASAVMLDILLVTELFSRLSPVTDFPNLVPLSLFFKNPLPDRSGVVVNSFRLQYRILERSLEELMGKEEDKVL
jgi:myo-inositol-1-phosphate synthase